MVAMDNGGRSFDFFIKNIGIIHAYLMIVFMMLMLFLGFVAHTLFRKRSHIMKEALLFIAVDLPISSTTAFLVFYYLYEMTDYSIYLIAALAGAVTYVVSFFSKTIMLAVFEAGTPLVRDKIKGMINRHK